MVTSFSGSADAALPLKAQASLNRQKPVGSNNNVAPLYFGEEDVSSRVFLRRRYVFAMVNDRPVVDGHVLICPVR